VSGAGVAAGDPTALSPRKLGVRADVAATLTAQNTWLGGIGNDFLIAFAEQGNGFSTWSENIDQANTFLSGFRPGVTTEMKWAVPIAAPGVGANAAQCSAAIDAVIAGQCDTDIRSLAQIIAADATQAVIDIRPGWEPNYSTSYPWGSTMVSPTQYIAAFRKVVTLFRAVDKRFRVTYCVGVRKDSSWPIETLYPGDDYVDLIGIDAYVITADRSTMKDAQHVDYMFDGFYTPDATQGVGINQALALARLRGKRFCVPEWGTCYDNPLFVERMADFVRSNAVEFHGYWDQNNASFTCKLSADQWPNSAMAYVRNFGAFNLDTWGIQANPGARLHSTIQAGKPLQRIEVTAGNTSGVSVLNGVELVAEPQISGTRRVTVKGYDERGQSSSRSIALTWQAGRLWTPGELGANLTDWYSLDLHGTVSRHIGAIKSIASLASSTRTASASTAVQRPTYAYSSGAPRASLDGGDALVQSDVTSMPAAQAAVTYAAQLYTDPAVSNFTYWVMDADANAGVRGVGVNAGNLRMASTGGVAGGAVTGDRSVVVSFGAGASAALRGTIDGNTASTGSVAIGAATYTRRVIGANAGASNAVGSFYLGALSELAVLNVAASTGQEDFLHGYFAWKYGRESSLPGGHAYKSNPPVI